MAFLSERGLAFEAHDLTRERISREILELAIDESRIEETFDHQSPFYTLFGLDRKMPDRRKAIKLILEEPGLVKVPLVIGEMGSVFGWSAERFEEMFGGGV
jgi:arsenate reductase-like glutaredoxin family protein